MTSVYDFYKKNPNNSLLDVLKLSRFYVFSQLWIFLLRIRTLVIFLLSNMSEESLPSSEDSFSVQLEIKDDRGQIVLSEEAFVDSGADESIYVVLTVSKAAACTMRPNKLDNFVVFGAGGVLKVFNSIKNYKVRAILSDEFLFETQIKVQIAENDSLPVKGKPLRTPYICIEYL